MRFDTPCIAVAGPVVGLVVAHVVAVGVAAAVVAVIVVAAVVGAAAVVAAAAAELAPGPGLALLLLHWRSSEWRAPEDATGWPARAAGCVRSCSEGLNTPPENFGGRMGR